MPCTVQQQQFSRSAALSQGLNLPGYQQTSHFPSTGTAAASKATEAFYTHPDINLWTPPESTCVYLKGCCIPLPAPIPLLAAHPVPTWSSHTRHTAGNGSETAPICCLLCLCVLISFSQLLNSSKELKLQVILSNQLRTCYRVSWYWFRNVSPAPALGKCDRLPRASQHQHQTLSKPSLVMTVKHTRCCSSMGKPSNPSCLEELVL